MRKGKRSRAIWAESDLIKEAVNDSTKGIIGSEEVIGIRNGAKPLGFKPAPANEIKEYNLPGGRVMRVSIAPGQRVNLKKEIIRQTRAVLI